MKTQRSLEVAVAAHDLRNHLSIIGAASKLVRHELLDSAEPDGEGIARLLGCMTAAVRDSRALLDELLIATGTMRPDGDEFAATPVDLVGLVRRLLALERCACETHAFHLCARVPVIGLWNEARVARIIRNLVSNAIKYSPSGSDIVVEIDRCAEYAVIRVHDQGIGIPSVDAVSVFAPFHRAPNAIKSASGDGLGLVSAVKLAASLGGTLEHYPRPEGGTTFTLRLPLD